MDHLIASLSEEDTEDHTVVEAKDSRPVYLMISSKRALMRKYGPLGFERLDTDLKDLKRAIEERADLRTLIAYVDDKTSLSGYGVGPVEPTDPGQIKELVDEFDTKLARQGREIRYLLIVGGDGVIPFHRLPNSVGDQDADVLSDNPYGCRDANYLVPERAIGRMPDGEKDGLGFLHTLIHTATTGHRSRTTSKGLLSALSSAFRPLKDVQKNGHGLGYSASIWRKASRAVFRVIGNDGQLRTCPPLTYEGFKIANRPHFSYFNLHGIEDGPNWYGQRDALFPAEYPLFPLALRPADLRVSEHAGSVVFTEACYGANIIDKSSDDSIALRLLTSRALAVVGSTKVSYGSIAPPLLGADLIGKYFWEGLRAHLTAGAALKHAKLSLAREMQERQGYLDGEDQKALTSFVLYGDPSLPITHIQGEAPATVCSTGFCPPVICNRETARQKEMVSDDLVASVKGQIETSLPHMSHARLRAKRLAFCHGGCEGRCGLLGQRAKGMDKRPGGWAFTLEKHIPVEGDREHCQVVKLTVDESGHILKMAVSK
jgi:hypothetical protein